MISFKKYIFRFMAVNSFGRVDDFSRVWVFMSHHHPVADRELLAVI